MKYYQDITLLPDDKNNFGVLLQKVYQQIHIALADNKVEENISEISVSFPKYCNQSLALGNRIRLVAPQKLNLDELNIIKWIGVYKDNLHIKSIQPVPSNVNQFACFTRKEVKGRKCIAKKAMSKAKHRAEKFNLSLEKCLKEAKDNAPKPFSPLPFINVFRSEKEKDKGKHSFKLFIEMKLVDQEVDSTFNCYGLSKGNKEGILATVPHF